jgi:hypothetical protein
MDYDDNDGELKDSMLSSAKRKMSGFSNFSPSAAL